MAAAAACIDAEQPDGTRRAAGDGRFVHASKTGDAVKISRLDEAWFERRWVGARRPPIADRQSRSDD